LADELVSRRGEFTPLSRLTRRDFYLHARAAIALRRRLFYALMLDADSADTLR
jgi:hypothetical protein